MKLKVITLMLLSLVLSYIPAWANLTKNEVSQLYVSIFGRASEGEGNAYWQSHSDIADAANAMLDTQAAKGYFGTNLNTNQAFIEHIYLNTLNKTIADDFDGINYWVGLLDAGTTRGEAVATLVGVINDYAPGGLYYDPDDTATVAAYNQFVNRVEVSNYMADNVYAAPDNWERSTSFSHDMVVTDDPATVSTAMVVVNGFNDALSQIKQIMTAYFGLFQGFRPDFETLESEVLPHLAAGFLNSGYDREDFITWLSEDETAGPVNESLIDCAILRPMTTQYYGLQPVEENHDNYSEAVWVLVTSQTNGFQLTWLSSFVNDGSSWKWYGNRSPFRVTLNARPEARQLLYPAESTVYHSGLNLWHDDIDNLALNMGITNLAIFNSAFAPGTIDNVAVNCVRLERSSGGLSSQYRLNNVPHYWGNDTLYELSKENGDRLIDLDNLKSQETMEFVAIGLNDAGNPVRTWLYTIPEPPLPVSNIEADPDSYFAVIEQDMISFDPFPGNGGIFTWTLPENPDLFPSWATLGWDDANWNWNVLRLLNPSWYAPHDFSAWTSDLFDPGPNVVSPRTGSFNVAMRDNNDRHYKAEKRYDPWSESFISVENDHLVFDVSHEWDADNHNPSWSSLNARTRIRGKYINRFEAPFVVENASTNGNAYAETEIKLGYQPAEDFGNGDTNFIGVWTRIRYQSGELFLQGFVWGSRNANGTDEITLSPVSGNFPNGKQLSFNQTYHLAVEYVESSNQFIIEFTDNSGTYQSFYNMNEIPEFDADNFVSAEIRTRVRSLQEIGDSGNIRVRIDDTKVDDIIYDTFTGGFSNSKWDILTYE